MSYRRAVFILVTGLAVLSCAKKSLTRREVALRNGPKIAELRAKLEQIARLVDALSTATVPVAPDPPIVYDPSSTGAWRGNADFLPYDKLRPLKLDPGRSGVMGDGRIGLRHEPTAAPYGHLQAALSLAEDPPAGRGSNEAEMAALDAELFKRALATRYVIVVRTSVEHVEDNPDARRVRAEAFAIDIAKLGLVATASAVATGPSPPPYPVYQPHMGEPAPFELLADAGKQLLDKLAATGLKVVGN